jgi:hypothetical protein
VVLILLKQIPFLEQQLRKQIISWKI